jgi:NAD(P)-dependent dehydrogenase (short-subunit alcohol dehydrogenase family)
MSGTIVITGPNGGMSIIAVREYAKKHPDDHLVLLVRDPSKLPSNALPSSDKVSYEPFDMTSLEAVRETSRRIAADVNKGTLEPIKTLVCSAAIQVSLPKIRDGTPRLTKVDHRDRPASRH